VVDVNELAAEGVMVVKRGPNAGSSFALDKALITAGRHPDSDIFLDDITVSRRHVEIIRSPEGYQVRDVGSLNGTYLNRERIEQAPLVNGDEVQVGKFKLVFFSGPRRGA
jgi:pSer/pThr/pTyr-binding forkhead associated (FHA) protein